MLYDLLKIITSFVFNLLNLVLGGRLPPFGSASVIVEQNNKYLVVELPRKRITFPGGFMNWQEHPSEAAKREAKEETGLDVEIDDFINFYSGKSSSWLQMSSISFAYRAHVVGGALQKSAEGIPLWMSEADLRVRLSPGGRRLLDDYIQHRERQGHI